MTETAAFQAEPPASGHETAQAAAGPESGPAASSGETGSAGKGRETQHPGKRRKRHFATWIALASALAAIIAAYVSSASVDVAKEQNIAAEQQQLVTITTFIAGQLADEQTTENQAAGNLTGAARSIAISNAVTGITAELTADAQAAAVLITDLHGHGVAGIEYIEVARALADGSDTPQAIAYYNDAVSAPPHDVPTRANALRNEAALLYSLGENAAAHRDMMLAARIFRGRLELTRSFVDNSIAQAYLGDASYQALIHNCGVAAGDRTDALRALAPLGSAGVNTTVQALLYTYQTADQKDCAS